MGQLQTLSHSVMGHFHHNKVGKTKWSRLNCLLEVISHNHAVAVAIGGIRPTFALNHCLFISTQGSWKFKYKHMTETSEVALWRCMEHFKQQNRGSWNVFWQQCPHFVFLRVKKRPFAFSCVLALNVSSIKIKKIDICTSNPLSIVLQICIQSQRNSVY